MTFIDGDQNGTSEHVCSLELAKQLAILGVKQESLFYWVVDPYLSHGKGYPLYYSEQVHIQSSDWQYYEFKEHYSAFTVSELGILIGGCYYTRYNCDNHWEVWCLTGGDDSILRDETRQPFQFKTEADARATLLIHLIKKEVAPNVYM